jgi:hypothetical protein
MSEKELREKIAHEIGQHAENCEWDTCSHSEQVAAYKSAEFIMSLVKANCWLKGEQGMPDITLNDAAEHDASEPWRAGNFTDSLQAFGKKAQRDMRVKGYKPCKEWDE